MKQMTTKKKSKKKKGYDNEKRKASIKTRGAGAGVGRGRKEGAKEGVPRKARQPRTLKTPSGLDDSQETLGYTMCGHGGTRLGKGGKGQRGEALKEARKEGKKTRGRKEPIKKENDKNLLHCNYWLAFQTRVNGLNRLP